MMQARQKNINSYKKEFLENSTDEMRAKAEGKALLNFIDKNYNNSFPEHLPTHNFYEAKWLQLEAGV